MRSKSREKKVDGQPRRTTECDRGQEILSTNRKASLHAVETSVDANHLHGECYLVTLFAS